MEEEITAPKLVSVKAIKSEHKNLQTILLTSETFTLGRALKNNVVIPIVPISRNHCVFKNTENNVWQLEDISSFGIKINGEKVGKGVSKILSDGDIIALEPTEEFVYKFVLPDSDDFEIPMKRIKLEKDDDNFIIDNVKKKFEQSQKYEITHFEEKLQSTKQLQANSIIMKQQVQLDLDRKIQQLEDEYAKKIENLEGEKMEVERQRKCLLEERDAQLASVRDDMEGKIKELKEQIEKHNETESDLLKENNSLKEKLTKEREEFLSELTRESSSKQDMLDKLEAKIREQEEVRLKEKQELEETLKRETELLRLAKEKEVRELEEQKRQRELELQEELDNIRKNLAEQMEQTEQQRLAAEQKLNEQMEQMKKLSDEEKVKMEQLQKEREEFENQLKEAQENAEKSKAELQKRVTDRETELAALAAERIQQQAEQSTEVINILQEQLEKVKSQLQTVETEKNSLLESICCDGPGEGTSKQTTLTEVGELMENELQCSICAELFIEAITLNCSHTFCKYCITMWKKKKRDCPICRAPIMSENRSLVLDTFIEKMVQNLTEEMKLKRQDILKFRAEEVLISTTPRSATNSARTRSAPTNSGRRRNTTTRSTSSRTTRITPAATTSASTTSAVATATAIQTVDLTNIPIPMGPAERPPVLPPPVTVLRPPLQQVYQIHQANPTATPVTTTPTSRIVTRHPIPTIDLTALPIPVGPADRPPLLPISRHQVPPQHVYRIRQVDMGQVMVVAGAGGVPLRAFRAPTTAATGGASRAAPAATGLPAVPSDNQMPFPFIPIDNVPRTRE